MTKLKLEEDDKAEASGSRSQLDDADEAGDDETEASGRRSYRKQKPEEDDEAEARGLGGRSRS